VEKWYSWRPEATPAFLDQALDDQHVVVGHFVDHGVGAQRGDGALDINGCLVE